MEPKARSPAKGRALMSECCVVLWERECEHVTDGLWDCSDACWAHSLRTAARSFTVARQTSLVWLYLCAELAAAATSHLACILTSAGRPVASAPHTSQVMDLRGANHCVTMPGRAQQQLGAIVKT